MADLSQRHTTRQIPLLVGREREQVTLRQALDEMFAGHGSLVLISGEAGIGKTTLVEWLANEAVGAGCLVLKGGCYDLTTTPPYGPWLEILRAYAHDHSLPPLPPFVGDLEATAALGSQDRLFSAVCDFFRDVSDCQPVVLLLEDLHWSDRASLDFLRVLARQLADQRVLILASYRADEVQRHHALHPVLPLLIREARAQRVDVRPLDGAEQRELIQRHCALSEMDEQRLVDYLKERAEGNPLYAGELLRTLEDEEVLAQTEGAWHLGDLTQVRVPALLRHVIEGRLARLDEQVRSRLQLAAIIGQDVPVKLWQQVSETSDDDLAQAIEEGQSEHLIEEAGTGQGYRFRHALFREALYAEVLAPRRHRWHLKVAETLATTSSADPDVVAYHLQQAGDGRAIEWLVKAGERAQRAYAFVTAGDRFEAALAILERNDETVGERGWLLWHLARMRRFSDQLQSIAYLDEALALARKSRDHVLIGNSLLDRGMILPQLGRVRLGLSDMEASVEILKTLTSADLRRPRDFASTLEVADAIVAEASITPYLSVAGRFIEARTRGEYVINAMLSSALPGTEQDTILSEAHFGVARAYGALGFAEQARGAFERAGELYVATGHHMAHGVTLLTELDQVLIPYYADSVSERRRIAAEAERALAKANSAAPDQPSRIASVPLLMLEGDWAAALQVLDAMPRQLEPFPMVLRAIIAIQQGDVERAWQLVRSTLPDGPETQPGDSDFVQFNRMQCAAATLALDASQLAAAREWLVAQDRWLAWSGAVLGRAENALGWARYHHLNGDGSLARTHAEKALAFASDPRQPLALIAVHRFLGSLDIAEKCFDNAEVHLRESLTLADACAAPFERALTLLALAELRVTRRQLDEATTLLDEVQAVCEPLEAKPTLERVHALRQQIQQTAKKAPLYPGGLSAREVEVLRLVAEGLTDNEIAERLFISRRTVTSHITNIFNKLGVNARAAAVAAAARSGIL